MEGGGRTGSGRASAPTAAVVSLLLWVGCGGGGTSAGGAVTPPLPAPVAISLIPSSANPLYGGTVTLTPVFRGGTATLGSSGAGSTEVSASATSGASVTVGPITAVMVFTLTVTNGAGARATVSSGSVTPQAVSISAISPASPTLTVGTSLALSAAVSGAADPGLAWSTAGGVGSWSGSTWTAPGTPGTYSLTATSLADGRVSASTQAMVVALPGAASLTPSSTNPLYGGTVILTPVFSGGTATLGSSGAGSTEVSASATSGASVTVGPITTVMVFTLTVTNGAGARATVSSGSVTPQAVSISAISPASPTLTVGTSLAFSAAVSGAADPGLAWSTGGGVGSWSGSTWTAPGTPGTYSLTATSLADGRVSASTQAMVVALPGAASLTPSSTNPLYGGTVILTPVFSGGTATLGTSGAGSSDVSASVANGAAVVVGPITTRKTFTLTVTSPTNVQATVDSPAIQPQTITVGPLAPAGATIPPGIPIVFSASISGAADSTLSWSASGGAGSWAGATWTPPAAPGSYIITATSVADASRSASTAVTVLNLPVISSFSAGPHDYVSSVQPSSTLGWSVTGATSLSLDQGIGAVTGSTSYTVSPTATTLYTLTASNAAGSVTKQARITFLALVQDDAATFHTEHCLFLIPTPGQVDWASGTSWNSLYSNANMDAFAARLNALFPSDYFLVVIAANNLSPNSVPRIITHRRPADGIGMGSIPVNPGPNYCLYNIGGGTVIDGALGVLDHEIGHCWGVFLGPEVGSGHWLANSTASGQLAASYFNSDYTLAQQIVGDPVQGFRWVATSNILKNETETFSDHDLYCQGLMPTFPDLYVLDSPVLNPDNTVTSTGWTRYDQAWTVAKNGPRVPDYRSSEKRHRIGLVYVARDQAEIQTVFMYLERSMNQFTNAEQIDTRWFDMQVPFLVDTKYRASVDSLLADLDGNHTPTLSLGSTYVLSTDGTATVSFTASDPDGPDPVVSCVPLSPNVSVDRASGTLRLQGLDRGSHFFTVKAEDAQGKKAFAHFVVDVN